jgi:hypothetical protein
MAANVLAFSNSIQWDIHRIQARGAAMTGGLYNVSPARHRAMSR